MLSRDIFNNDYPEESFFFFFCPSCCRHGVALLPQPLLWKRFGWGTPHGRGQLADWHIHPVLQLAFPTAGARQPGSAVPTFLSLPPSPLCHLQSGLLRLPDLTLPVCKEQRVELRLQSCKVAFQGRLERKATADRS